MHALFETRVQRWRAVALLADGVALLTLGRREKDVRQGYETSFFEVLHPWVRERVKSIKLERWQGTALCGQWVRRGNLIVPVVRVDQN